MIPPCPTRLIQECLQCDWLFVPDVIDPSNARLQDRRFNGAQIVRGRKKLKQGWFPPDTQKVSPRKPTRCLDHQDSTPVDHSEPKRHGTRSRVLRALEK